MQLSGEGLDEDIVRKLDFSEVLLVAGRLTMVDTTAVLDLDNENFGDVDEGRSDLVELGLLSSFLRLK